MNFKAHLLTLGFIAAVVIPSLVIYYFVEPDSISLIIAGIVLGYYGLYNAFKD